MRIDRQGAFSIEAAQRTGPGRFGSFTSLASGPAPAPGDYPLSSPLVAALGRDGATAVWERLGPGETPQEEGSLLESGDVKGP